LLQNRKKTGALRRGWASLADFLGTGDFEMQPRQFAVDESLGIAISSKAAAGRPCPGRFLLY